MVGRLQERYRGCPYKGHTGDKAQPQQITDPKSAGLAPICAVVVGPGARISTANRKNHVPTVS